MKEKQFEFIVKLHANNKDEFTLKTFTSLQNARKYVKKKQERNSWGIPMERNMTLRIYKKDIKTGQPITIYLN